MCRKYLRALVGSWTSFLQESTGACIQATFSRRIPPVPHISDVMCLYCCVPNTSGVTNRVCLVKMVVMCVWAGGVSVLSDHRRCIITQIAAFGGRRISG
jgi:hypothetical protein